MYEEKAGLTRLDSHGGGAQERSLIEILPNIVRFFSSRLEHYIELPCPTGRAIPSFRLLLLLLHWSPHLKFVLYEVQRV